MSKNSGIGHVWAANVGEDGRPNGVGPVWIENISAIGGGGGGSIPSEVSGKWEDASNCVESNSAAWGAGSFTGVSAGDSLTGNGYDIPLGLNTPVVMQNNESTASYNQYGMSVNDGNGMQTLGVNDIRNWNDVANTVSSNSSSWNDTIKKTAGVRQRIDMGGNMHIDLGLSTISNTPGVMINDKTTLGQDYLQVKYQNGIFNADNTINVFGDDISIELKNNKNNVSSKLTNTELTFNSGADTASLNLYDISALKSASGGGGATGDYVPYSGDMPHLYLGSNNTITSGYSTTKYNQMIVGTGNNVKVSNAYVFGDRTTANAGGNLFSLGIRNGVGQDSFTFGNDNNNGSNGVGGFIFGPANIVNGNGFVFGTRNRAENYGTSIGAYCSAYKNSICIGYGCVFSGKMVGNYIYDTEMGLALGRYNSISADAALVIGNGSANSARSDSFVVYHDGSVSAAGNVSANGHELPIVEYVSNSAAATGTNILYVVTGSN